MSEWKVLFDTNFWGSAREEDPAYDAAFDIGQPMLTKEYPINQAVDWCGETWRLLSLYTCEKGLVIDYCKQIDPAELAAFIEKFQAAGLEENFDEEVFERMQLDNPTVPNAMLEVYRGACKLQSLGSSGIHYQPLAMDGEEPTNDPLSLACMEHYQLDQNVAYTFSRAHFLWDEGHVQELSGLKVTFSEQIVSVSGEHFTLTGEKQNIPLTHPISGKKYTLHIDRIEAGELSQDVLEWMGEKMVYPKYFETVHYAFDPPCENVNDSGSNGCDQKIYDPCIVLQACVKGDSPIPKKECKKAAASVSVIGRADGPTSIFVMGRSKSEIHLNSICSPLFFEPTPVREWRVSYRVKRRDELSVALPF